MTTPPLSADATAPAPITAAILNLDRQAIKAHRVTDPYSLHRLVYSLFADVRDDQQKRSSVASGILYADKGGDARGRKILLMADREPDGQPLGLADALQCKSVPESFLQHRAYRFQTVVNPTRRDSRSRKLVAAKSRPDIMGWFCQSAARSWGFEVAAADAEVTSVEVLRFTDKHKNPITLAQAQITGTLIVTDHAQFQRSFRQGIGRGRAFGCGLLQIVPIPENPFA